ncbi:HNH/ENDO VII family nuclease [Mycobacteroides immunogenum]|uniref:HNH/ENDO VII family nuclease n=1 Tax=Mycobacteroides immunogenum TaxID=83262 RepID=UPI0009BF1111|nr:HNH/ENDO VII family nuclease [Mycobacteroides immunogenum]
MTTLDEFMAINPNAYMAVVDTWRPQTRQFKEAYDDYKRWAGSPAGTEWTGRTSNAAYETASTDCHGSDNADDTVEEGGKLIGATIEYEVLPNLTGGQNLIERVLAHAEQGVSIDQNFNMTYTPAEGESDESIARNREHVKESERQVKEHVAKWEKGCQTLKGQAEATAQSITGCINPKTALVDGRKVLRDAVAPKPGDGTATAIDYKKQYPKATDPAGTTPASASNPETINYKELYPKTASVDGHQLGSIGAMPGVGDIDKTKPAKLAPTLADRDVPAFAQATRERLQHEGVPANQIEQRVNEAVQRAQAPRFAPDADPMRTPGQVPLHNSPGDQFNDIVGRANDEATKTIDGQIEQAKVLTGQAGPGAPGVAEAWKDVGLGAVKQVHELTSDPLAAPKMGIEQAKEFYNHPGEFIGKNLIHGTEALGGGAIGGEAAAGVRGLLGDLTGTEGRAITHGLDDATPGHHTPTHVEHHTATGDHNSPSHPTGHLPPEGEPGSFGYDADGNRLRYANGRPDYGPGQIPEVWNTSREDQLSRIETGKLDLPEPGPGQQWVELHPRGPVDESWTVENGHRLIDWQPGEPQKGLWDMGHIDGREYRTLREAYLSGQMTFEEYIAEYRNPDNYRVQDWYRNRSHIDEGP